MPTPTGYSRQKDPRVTVAIVEDNRYLRTGWEALLSTVPDFTIAGTFGRVEETLPGRVLERVDVLLMDIGLPGMSGIEGTRRLVKAYPDLAVVMVTVHDDDQHVFDALCAGAVGYLLKNVEPVELISAVRVAKAGGSPMTPNVARMLIETFRRPEDAGDPASEELTPREREVLAYLAKGYSYRGVAEATGLSVDGVRYHIRHIYEKLHVHSRAQAVATGLKERIITAPE